MGQSWPWFADVNQLKQEGEKDWLADYRSCLKVRLCGRAAIPQFLMNEWSEHQMKS